MPDPIDFWLEFGSTYSHLSAQRIEALAETHGVRVRWRPFLLGAIFKAQGWADSPFNLFPTKGAYMWRDLERRAAVRGVAYRRPSAFPRSGLLAARVALAVRDEPWAHDYMRAVFRANFVDDRDIASAGVIAELLRGHGQAPEPILERATAQATKDALRESTEQAMAAGVFGAPTFAVDGELFWGDDRLEDAVEWALGRHPAR